MANWSKILSRGDVEDRRAFGPTTIGGGLGIGGLALVLLFNYLNTGTIDVGSILSQLGTTQTQTTQAPIDDSYKTFASEVLGSTNDTWSTIFNSMHKTYEEPKLVLFRGATESGCGGTESYEGPHYCPNDQTIYLDETFFDELKQLGAQGDVAQAYVIAHEVGHNVQNQLGLLNNDNTNAQSVHTELQADCFAGVWANSIKDQGILEPGEIKEAMDAAAAVGDDRIQQQTEGHVTPETWTHGSSQQRLDSFTKGYGSGYKACI